MLSRHGIKVKKKKNTVSLQKEDFVHAKEARLENVMWKYYVTLVLTPWGIRSGDQISISTKVT